MTRLAVLADIHGNLPALKSVIDDMARFSVDQAVVAGDSVNWGPFSRQVMELIDQRRWPTIRGNNELYALDYATPRMPAHWSSFTLPPLLREQLGDARLQALACLPDELSLRFIDAPPIRVVHGVPGDPWKPILPMSPPRQVAAWLADVAEDHVICAHSHIALRRRVGRWKIFNPGSVGIPLDGERSASYLILEGDRAGWRLEAHRRVPFSNEANFAEFAAQRFAERGGLTAELVIEEFESARLRLTPYLEWKRRFHASQPESPALLREFRALEDPRPFMPRAYRDLRPELRED